MKIRLKVSVKVRGGRVFVPGVYDSENEGFSSLFDTLTGNESSDICEVLEVPVPILESSSENDDLDSGKEDGEDGEDETEEVEEVFDEEEEKPKKKGKKGKKGK